MELVIVVALTIVTLWWGVRMTAWRTVNALCASPRALHCVVYRPGGDWLVTRNRLLRGTTPSTMPIHSRGVRTEFVHGRKPERRVRP